ncbi:MAG: hypothetical protein GY765_03230, partial [bacterium]|nr:hypothetical protein [bacterium]
MKKSFMLFLLVLLTVSFLTAGVNDKDRDARKRQQKEEYLAANPNSADNAQGGAVTITLKAGSEYNTDSSGDFVLYGAVLNSGTTGAVFAEVEVTLFDSGNGSLGTDSTFIQGGTNRNLSTSTQNVLLQGETGYFKISTSVSAASVDHWTLSYDWEEYSHTACLAPLAIVGTPVQSNSSGDMRITGVVRNAGSTHTGYFAEVYMAMFNSSNQLIGLESTFVD